MSDLLDKIVQQDNSSKANFQALTARLQQWEFENDHIKNGKQQTKKEIKAVKGKLKSA